MNVYFNLHSTCDVYVKEHIPNRHLRLASSHKQCFPMTDQTPYSLNDYVRSTDYISLTDYVSFIDYICDADNKVIGAKFLCDHGGGYYAKEGKKEVCVFPGDTVKFDHEWTDVNDDGCPESSYTTVRFYLEWHHENDNLSAEMCTEM